MKFLIILFVLSLNAHNSFAGSFVDSLANKYGKKNGCYSISLDKKEKGSKAKYISNENKQGLKKDR